MLSFNEETIKQIMKKTNTAWEPVKKKEYTLFATQLPAGYMYANMFEQYETDCALKSVYGSSIVKEDCVDATIRSLPHYTSDGKSITMCGTQYELWQVPHRVFLSKYKLTLNADLDAWVSCVPNLVKRKEVGLQIPIEYEGAIITDSGYTLYVNSSKVEGHGYGDILVADTVNNEPDYSTVRVINCKAFDQMFDASDNTFFLNDRFDNAASYLNVVQRYGVTYEQLLGCAPRVPEIEKALLMHSIIDRKDMERWCLMNIPTTVSSFEEMRSIALSKAHALA